MTQSPIKTPTPPSPPAPSAPQLKRELGLFGAVMLGLGSIIGTGVFVSIGIGAGITGPSIILAIALAAILATCNALSSAQLAASYPVSGGTYEYGYRLLRPELGFTAGWMFLCAKSASAATAALGVVAYGFHLFGAQPGALLPLMGCAVALCVMALVLSGLRRSNVINTVIVSFTLLALIVFCLIGLSQLANANDQSHFTPFFKSSENEAIPLLYSTALMFVAYTGYGRIATMGEEVRNPRRTIPRAIIATLIVSAVLYIAVALAAIGAVGADNLSGIIGNGIGNGSNNATPLETAARAMALHSHSSGLGSFLGPLIALAAITAMLGVLLNLVLGLSRVALAMGRRKDLPPMLAKLSAAQSPRAAIIFVGLIIAGLALIGDIKTVWSFSAFTVLIYYSITNLSALKLPPEQRLYPRFISWAGLIGCLSLAFFVPVHIWLIGLGLIGLGLIWHKLCQK